jgi:hypothetical protein
MRVDIMIRLTKIVTIIALGACSCSTDEQTPPPVQYTGGAGFPTGGSGGTGGNSFPTGGSGGTGGNGFPTGGIGETGGNGFLTGGSGGVTAGNGSPTADSGTLTCSPKCAPQCDPACEACTDGKWIERLGGRVVDEQASPVPEADVLMCVFYPNGMENCLQPIKSDATGAFEVAVPDEARCISSAVLSVTLIGTDHTPCYCHLDLPDMQSSVTIEQPFILYQTTRATVLPPEGDKEAARTVVFADGLELDVTPKLFYAVGGGYPDFAVRRLPPDANGLCFVKDPSTLIAVYGFSPTGEIGDAGYPVRISNTTNLPAGTDVALYVLGGLSCMLPDNTFVHEGDWVQYGTGKVSADGLMIEGDAVPCLYWFGYGPIN